MKRRLSLSLLSLSIFLLVGCTAITPVAPTATQESAVATTAPEVAASASDCEEGFRLFDHELLATDPVCIPIAPQRVLPLDMASLEIILLTGNTPVATAEWILEELPLLVPAFADDLAGMEGVGYPASLEQVALLKPDLILATDDTIDVEQAAKIAPVIVPDQAIYEDWKFGMEFFSAVLNVPELYVEMEENYNARVAELQAALGDDLSQEISVISASTYGVSLWMPDSPPGTILAHVGLARPEAQALVGDAALAEYGEAMYVGISDERLDLADGDVIFYFTYAAMDPEVADMENEFIKAFEQKPIWQSLDAVKAEQAFFVPGYWWRAQTYLLANQVIDDLFTYLTDTTATTPIIADANKVTQLSPCLIH